MLRYTVIIYKFTQGNIGTKKNRQKPISVASQEKKSQIATLATDSAIPGHLTQSAMNYLLYYTQVTEATSIRTQLDAL